MILLQLNGGGSYIKESPVQYCLRKNQVQPSYWNSSVAHVSPMDAQTTNVHARNMDFHAHSVANNAMG